MGLIITAFELSLISSFTVLALFLSYSMLNVCDLSTDGCFTLGAVVGSVVVLKGHPLLALPAAMCVGMLSGCITALLQTYLGVPSLLAGIVVNTALYSVNIAVMGNASLLNLNRVETIFSKFSKLRLFAFPVHSRLILLIILVALTVVFMTWFLKTRLGLAIRATGNNIAMVRSSSINPAFITIVGLMVSNSFTALSGCILAMYQKSSNINMGSGMVTIALASLLIGNVFFPKTRKISLKAFSVVVGSFVFRLVYTVALRLNMPAFMLKFVSSVIVVIAISTPYLKNQLAKRGRRRA